MTSLDDGWTAMNNTTDDDSHHSHIMFGWLYRMPNDFIICLRQKQPLALSSSLVMPSCSKSLSLIG